MPRRVTSAAKNAEQDLHFLSKFPIYSRKIVKLHSLLFLLHYSLKMKLSIRGQMLCLGKNESLRVRKQATLILSLTTSPVSLGAPCLFLPFLLLLSLSLTLQAVPTSWSLSVLHSLFCHSIILLFSRTVWSWLGCPWICSLCYLLFPFVLFYIPFTVSRFNCA